MADPDVAARYTVEQARRVLAATNAAKMSAARAHMPYKCVCCGLIPLKHSAVLIGDHSLARSLTHSLTLLSSPLCPQI